MTDDTLLPFDLPAVSRKKVTADFAGGSISSDGGLVLLRGAERRLGLAETLAGCIREWRDPDRVVHSLPAMLRFRMFAIACGYEDADDCDELRADPLFKLAVGRAPESGRDLCSQPTMSRLENAPSSSEVGRMTAALVDIFCRSFPSPPAAIVLDIDETCDAVHGHQQLSLFNAFTVGVALAFVSSIGNFGIPLFLGQPAGYQTLPVLIFSRLSGFGPSIISEVAVLAILVSAIAAIGVAVQSWLMRRGDFRTIGVPSRPLAFALGSWRLPAEAGCWLVILLVLVLPVTALIAITLVPAFGVPLTWNSLTVDAYVEVLWRQAVTVRAFQNSGFLAATATILLVLASVPMAYFIAWRRSRLAGALGTVIDIPYAMPGIVLAIAAILVFLKPLPVIEYSLYGTLWIILVAYLGRFATLAVRPAIAGLTQMDRGMDEAARMTGAGFGFRLRTVIGPLTLPLTAAGGILVFLTAFNELTVSALLWSSGSETLGVVLYNLDESGNHIQAAAIAVVSIVVIVALMFAAHFAGRRLPAGVLPWRD